MKLIIATILELALFVGIGAAYANDYDETEANWMAKAVIVPHYGVPSAPVYPESGDRVLIDDMTYVLVRACDWSSVTAAVARVTAMYNQMHATESGRTMLHGKRGHTTITNGTITVEYADGYKAVEAIKSSATKSPATNIVRRVSTISGREGVAPRRHRPARLEELLKQRDAILKSKPREVTVTVEGGK